MRCVPLQGQIYIKTESRDIIYNISRGFDKVTLVGSGHEPNEYFEREPSVADALDVEEGDVRVGLRLVKGPGGGVVRRVHSDVEDHRNAHVGVRLEAERQDRHADEEH